VKQDGPYSLFKWSYGPGIRLYGMEPCTNPSRFVCLKCGTAIAADNLVELGHMLTEMGCTDTVHLRCCREPLSQHRRKQMKIVIDNVNRVPMSSIGAGSVFRYNNEYYIRPYSSVVDRFGIGGINLTTGGWIPDSTTMMVEPVEMEARVTT
jgi:hypothetical protein